MWLVSWQVGRLAVTKLTSETHQWDWFYWISHGNFPGFFQLRLFGSVAILLIPNIDAWNRNGKPTWRWSRVLKEVADSPWPFEDENEAHLMESSDLAGISLEPWDPCVFFNGTSRWVALNLHSFAKVMPLLEGGSCAYVRDAQVLSENFLLNLVDDSSPHFWMMSLKTNQWNGMLFVGFFSCSVGVLIHDVSSSL